jgi:hypothetical protein
MRDQGESQTGASVDMAAANELPKDRVLAVVAGQPDDSSYEEILRAIAMELMVNRGLADSEAGRTISNEEMDQRIRTWQK